MAGNRIEFDISAQDKNGTFDNLNNKAKQLNTQLERTKKLQEQITGTQTGASAARRAGYQGGMDAEDYTRAGGVAGRGGAAARDFADQARGLGGLVRIYAILAAQLYAVEAAFTAMRNAMQTDMLIKGLDQLGASSGVALGGLAKQFAAISDGAISLRTAGEMTAKAMSSGMNPQQFLELGQVAKSAAQALGLNMEDAVSRLTRGIVKLEPELLDELGLFTKLEKSVQDYARTAGKAESQLSDFERRQAFANAVIAEGQQKFKDISQEGNPFDRLLASLQNTAQSILSVINTVVGPIAKILADNTGLIGAGIAMMALRITQMAIPALGAYQKYLASAAESAADYASVTSEKFRAGQVSRAEKAAGIPESQAKIAVLNQELAIIEKQNAAAKKQGAAVADVIAMDNKRLRKQMEITAELNKQQAAYQKVEDQMNKFQASDFHGMMMGGIAKGARRDKITSGINLNLAENFGERGFVESFKAMSSMISDSGLELGKFGKTMAFVSGTATILFQALTTIATWASRFIPVIGGVILAYEVLNSVFSKNEKEVKKFESALEGLEETTKTAQMTMEKFKGAITAESIVAVSNNFNGLTNSIKELNKTFDAAEKAASWFDTIKDGFKGIFGFSRQDLATEQLGKSLEQAIKSAPQGPIAEGLKQKLSAALKTTELTAEGMEKALDRLDKKTFSQVSKVIQDIISDADKVLDKSKVLTKNIEESTKKSTQSYQNLANSVRDSSPLTTFLMDTIKRTQDLTAAFSDGTAARSAMESLINGGAGTLQISEADSSRLTELLNQYKELDTQVQEYTNSIAALEDISKKQGAAKSLFSGTTKQIEDAKQGLNSLRDRMASIQEETGKIVSKSFSGNLDLLFQQYDLRIQKLRIDAQRNLLSLIPGQYQTEASVRARAGLDQASITVESRLADINERLVLQTELGRIAQERNTDATLLDTKVRQAEKATNLREAEKLNDEIILLQKRLEQYGKADEISRLAGTGDIQGVRKVIEGSGAVMFANILPLLQKSAERRAGEAAQRLSVEAKKELDLIGVSFDQNIRKAETSYNQLKTQLSGLSQFLSQGYQQQLDLYAQGIKDRADVLKLEKDIAQMDKLATISTGDVQKGALAGAQEARNRLADLKAQQAADNAIKQRNANTLISIDLEKQRADAAVSAAENMRSLLDTTTSVGVAASEQLRQQIFAIRQIEGAAIYQLQTAGIRRDIDAYDARFKQMTPQQQIREVESPEAQSMAIARTALAAADAAQQQKRSSEEQGEATNRELARRDLVLKQYDEQVQAIQIQRDLENQLFRDRQTNDQLSLDSSRSILTYKQTLNLLTQDEADRETRKLDRMKIDADLQNKLRDIENDRLRIQQEFNREYARQKAAGTLSETGDVDALTRAKFEAGRAAADSAENTARRAASVQTQILDNQALVTSRMKTYSDAWKGLFDGMGKSMVDWMMTGKWTGSQLLKNLVANLLTYELQLQMHAVRVQAIQAMGGSPGGSLLAMAGKFIMGAFGGATGGYSAAYDAAAYPQYYGGVFAKGGMFNQGVQAYARGGMFTNQVVNQPTLFKAANGLGVMGEAGPEAIMPLRRNSSGVLGVEGNSASSVQVNVNNFSNEKADAKETVDSKGNRRIDIVIGEAVNPNITRSGGTTQEAIKSTFGLRSSLIRR